ncbi:TPA: transposase [Enterococcus faecalis]|uniref:transposase n=1 Tax=Enterococcus faecalis TaxID=1351 RepID=UPI0036D50DA6
MKSNWRFLLKDRTIIDHLNYKTCRSFLEPNFLYLTKAMIIDRLLDFSPKLCFTYQVFHELTESFRRKNPQQLFEQLCTIPEKLDETFSKNINNLLTYEEGIHNAMIYPYSNGKTKVMNTLIKAMNGYFK